MVIPTRRNRGGSTDMGDLSHLIPVCHPYTGGAVGSGHSNEYLIKDYETAVVNPAKIMAMVVIDLLAADAVKAKETVETHRPALTKQAYLKLQRNQAQVIRFDGGG